MLFFRKIVPSFSQKVNPNLVGCRLHIAQEIKASVECVKLVYSCDVTSFIPQTNT